jgi:hypothetical protein
MNGSTSILFGSKSRAYFDHKVSVQSPAVLPGTKIANWQRDVPENEAEREAWSRAISEGWNIRSLQPTFAGQ